MDEKAASNVLTLAEPIKQGDNTITEIQIIKPRAGNLRGVKILDLLQLDIDALIRVLPRVTMPPLTDEQVKRMGLPDLTQAGGILAGFFTQSESSDM